jgi:GTP pyrophosphokinase
VGGMSNCQVKFARCCTPIPGDDIIGYVTRGYGISVHRRDCVNVKNSSEEDQSRWIEVHWDESNPESKERFSTALQISTTDRVGVMSDVLLLLSNNHVNICDFNGKTLSEGYGIINAVIDVTGIPQLEMLINKLRSIKGVINVTRQSN